MKTVLDLTFEMTVNFLPSSLVWMTACRSFLSLSLTHFDNSPLKFCRLAARVDRDV